MMIKYGFHDFFNVLFQNNGALQIMESIKHISRNYFFRDNLYSSSAASLVFAATSPASVGKQ